jgi:hypothetical protein
MLGFLGTEPDFSKNPNNPKITSSWRGWIDGQIVQVDAGSEGEAADLSQGILIVSQWANSRDLYNTPQRVGPVRVVSVDGTLVTLVPVDLRTPGVLVTPWAAQTPGTIFVFDLATRQWVEPASTPLGILSPSDPTKAAAATIVAQTNAEIATRAALTAAPTRTRGRPPSYPSSTPQLGLATGSGAKNSGEPFFISSWTGIVDGELIGVEAGREGRYGDVQQGVILVYNISRQEPAEIYQTPQRIGAVRIVAVVGNLFTLAPIDYRTPGALETPWAAETPGPIFTFDLSTRQ